MDTRSAQSGRHIQSSALHPSPLLAHRDLPPIILALVRKHNSDDVDDPVNSLPQSGVVEFVCTTPEVRARVKGVVMFLPDENTGVVPDSYWLPASKFGATSLWLAKRETGLMGGAGFTEPVENLAGTILAGRPIPDPGCMGFLFEAETTAEEIWGRFSIDCAGDGSTGLESGKWILKAAVDLVDPVTEVEWNRVLGRFATRARGLDLQGYFAA